MLLITHGWKKNHFGGRQQYSKCLIKALKKCEIKNFETYKIDPYKKENLYKKLFNLNMDHITDEDTNNILKLIFKKNISTIIIDCSSFGKICKKIKKIKNKINIIVVYHHIESSFFLKYFFNSLKFKYIYISIKMFINEFLSSRYSNKQIFFTKRDFFYGKFFYKAKNGHIFPIAQDIEYEKDNLENINILDKPYMLFVGGANLLPNLKGIIWFLKKVIPFVNLNFVVVGSGYENVIKNNNKKVFFLGKVDNLQPLYQNCEFVVAPIFSGSGMKTKVAEASGFGKMVFGTKEALTGYEDFINVNSILCNNANEFKKNISNYKTKINKKENVLEIFNKNYSIESMKNNYSNIIKQF